MGAPARDPAGSQNLTGGTGPLEAGEVVLLLDRRGRRYLATLAAGGVHDLRGGKIPHEVMIGREEGSVVESSRGERVRVFRPTLAEFVLEMPRGAQVIYPKDLAMMVFWGDVYSGATVVEAGTGSGALTMALLRAVGPSGRVFSYEIREDFARQARRNITRLMGEPETLTFRAHDIYDGIPDAPADRLLLDLPEPWRVVPHGVEALRPGGIWVSYVPTVPQAAQTVETLRAAGAFAMMDTFETLLRPWNIEGLSVRPAHRMVAHTGFVTTARRAARTGPAESAAPGQRVEGG
ncbi:MAG: tRNA (adenine-N1)-methyltransferase [bacterium]